MDTALIWYLLVSAKLFKPKKIENEQTEKNMQSIEKKSVSQKVNNLEIEPSQHEQHSQEAIELLEFKPYKDKNGLKFNSNEDSRFNLRKIAAQLTEDSLKMGMKNQTIPS